MRFDLPDDLGPPNFELVIPIRWGDMDAMGHVNNTVYFRYFETVRIAWFDKVVGLTDPTASGAIIINTFCTFIRQLKYPGDVLAKHYVSDPGRTSFMAWVTLERVDEPGVLYATGGAKTVWMDYRTGKSVGLPEGVRRLVSAPKS